jgi:hypothetical protein
VLKIEFEMIFWSHTADKTVGSLRERQQICQRSDGKFCLKKLAYWQTSLEIR